MTPPSATTLNPRQQLEQCLDRYDPAIAALARALLKKMERRLPGATELVYDNYNALVIGFGPNERATDCPFSLAVYARWVNLYFLEGADLEDPGGLLQGAGNRVRHIRLQQPQEFDAPGIQALIAQALAAADPPMPASARRRAIVIKSVSPRPRPRRPRTSSR
jgi:hypothetical protein